MASLRRVDYPLVSDETWELFTAWKENRTNSSWFRSLTGQQQQQLVESWQAIYSFAWDEGLEKGLSIASKALIPSTPMQDQLDTAAKEAGERNVGRQAVPAAALEAER